MRRSMLIVGCLVLSAFGPAHASSIMCDPNWAYGGAATTEESIQYIELLAEVATGQEDGQARLCPKLVQLRQYVRAGCISKPYLDRAETALAPFACGK